MRVVKTVQVPAKTQQAFDHFRCELCEAVSYDPNWAPRQYEVTEPQVTLRVGTDYPEGGSTIRTTLDICPQCFKEKLIPWFVSQGGIPREEELDW